MARLRRWHLRKVRIKGSGMDSPVAVAALYRFAPIADPRALRDELEILCRTNGIKGTLLVAGEGINGTIAGAQDNLASVIAFIRSQPDLAETDVKFSVAASMPFYRMKVRFKREIVTMGVEGIDPRASVGTYVAPQDWNALISDPGTIVIDTRNHYEVGAGTFAGAIDPGTTSFSEFPEWFRRERERLMGDGKPPRVAMFCTGGIRCEKSTAFLKAEGIEEVYHLKGGILKYLEEVPERESLWRGECFVFDERVTVGHGLALGTHVLCRACRRPINDEGRASPLYEDGVSCEACYHEKSDRQRASARERDRQEKLARARGQAHVGATRD